MRTCIASRSASEQTATVLMPMARAVRMTRQAISPLLAMRILEIILPLLPWASVYHWQAIGPGAKPGRSGFTSCIGELVGRFRLEIRGVVAFMQLSGQIARSAVDHAAAN